MEQKENNLYLFIIFALFLIVIFILPFRNDYELFGLKKKRAGFCGPDMSLIKKNDNVSFQNIGGEYGSFSEMTEKDCCLLRTSGQVCGVNLDNWETYECKFHK